MKLLRISREPNDYATAACPEEIAQAIRPARPGRFIVEEVSPAGQLLLSGYSCRRWGTAIRLTSSASIPGRHPAARSPAEITGCVRTLAAASNPRTIA